MNIRQWIALGLLATSAWTQAATRLQVEGHGLTLDQARQNGFRSAVEQAVGQVIVSDQEVRGDQLTKDWIGGYSAGYVDSYEILETHQEGSEFVVKMNVAVSPSKIAQRMMSSGNKILVIEGQRLQAQIDTQLDQRNRGDQLVAEVLDSYPYNAYVVNSGQTDIAIGQRREVYVDIPYEIRWSRFWLDALNETLGVVAADTKSCGSWFTKQDEKIRLSSQSGLLGHLRDTPCGQEADMRVKFNGTRSYYFYDRQTLAVILGQLQTPIGRQHIGLRVDLKDASGAVVDSRCARIDTSLFVSYTEPQFEVVRWNEQNKNLRPVVNGDANVYGLLRVHLHNKDQIENLNKISLTVEKTCA